MLDNTFISVFDIAGNASPPLCHSNSSNNFKINISLKVFLRFIYCSFWESPGYSSHCKDLYLVRNPYHPPLQKWIDAHRMHLYCPEQHELRTCHSAQVLLNFTFVMSTSALCSGHFCHYSTQWLRYDKWYFCGGDHLIP